MSFLGAGGGRAEFKHLCSTVNINIAYSVNSVQFVKNHQNMELQTAISMIWHWKSEALALANSWLTRASGLAHCILPSFNF